MAETENPFRTELAEALLNDIIDHPQRCGHSSDPMCCPFINFPLLGAWFTQAARSPEPLASDDPWVIEGGMVAPALKRSDEAVALHAEQRAARVIREGGRP